MSYKIERLDKSHLRRTFHCGQAALDDYLKLFAGQDEKRRAANAFVLVEPPSRAVLGYYTLPAISVILTDLPETAAAKMAKYPQVAATLLGRFAIDHAHQGLGLGATLLLDAMRRTYAASNDAVASQALVVDAIDDQAKSFYEKHSFLPLTANPMRLFITMHEIRNLLVRTGLAP